MNRNITFQGRDVGDAADIDFNIPVEVDPTTGLVTATPSIEGSVDVEALAADPAFTGAFAPVHASILAVHAGVSNTNWTITQNVGKQYGCYRFQTASPAVGDYIEWEVPLLAGTYRFELQHTTQNNNGIITLKVDGVAHGTTIDGYSAAAAIVNSALTGVAVPTTGRRTIRLEITGKNASSTDEYLAFSGWTLYRTGA